MNHTTAMKTKHTPGPWQVMPEEYHRDYIRIRGTSIGGKYKVANVCGIKVEGSVPINELEEVRANAALIAAAPELYEACVAAESILSNMDTLRHLGDFPALDSLRAAIQKASIGHK